MLWGTVPEWVGALGNVGVAIAAGLAAWQGIRSLHTWRDEAIGTRRAEIAAATLADFYRAQSIYHDARARLVLNHEMVPEDGEDEAFAQAAETAPYRRLEKHREFLARFRAREFEMAAWFGEEARKPFDEFRKAHNDLIWAVEELWEYSQAGREERPIPDHIVQASKIRGRATKHEEDEFAKRIDAAIKDIERICRPAIEARAT